MKFNVTKKDKEEHKKSNDKISSDASPFPLEEIGAIIHQTQPSINHIAYCLSSSSHNSQFISCSLLLNKISRRLCLTAVLLYIVSFDPTTVTHLQSIYLSVREKEKEILLL